MFSSHMLGAKGFAAEQKIKEFKKLLFKSKKPHKATSTSRFNPKKLICKATSNMNNIQFHKYGYPPKAIKENVISSEKFRDIYNFYRLLELQKHAERYILADAKKDKLLCRRLREPLKVGERVPWGTCEWRMCHSLTVSKYLWLEKSLKLLKIINFIGFQKKAMIR